MNRLERIREGMDRLGQILEPVDINDPRVQEELARWKAQSPAIIHENAEIYINKDTEDFRLLLNVAEQCMYHVQALGWCPICGRDVRDNAPHDSECDLAPLLQEVKTDA